MGFLGRSVKSIKVQRLGRGWATAGTSSYCYQTVPRVLGRGVGGTECFLGPRP